MRKLKITQSLHYVLVIEALDHFTIPELRDACCFYASSNAQTGHNHTYKTMYRQLERLVSKGLLTKVKQISNSVRYQKTEAFQMTEFDIQPVPMTELHMHDEIIVKNKKSLTNLAIEEQLRNLASVYKVDLLTCIGESEEYIRLYSDFPELKVQLEPKYHESRERSSKLLGKIKALDTVLSQLSNLANK
ncbi:hypothetical protein VI06_14485 [Aquitalea magnusonii]|nr:hypothetical protein VI06_14485 [Aquitalea magnusonii]